MAIVHSKPTITITRIVRTLKKHTQFHYMDRGGARRFSGILSELVKKVTN